VNITFYDSIKPYKEKIEPILLKEEAKHNVILGVLNQLSTNIADLSNIFMCTVEEGDKPVLVFLRTHPHNLLIAGNPNQTEAISFAVQKFAENGFTFPGVTGEKQLAEFFAEEWKRATGIEGNVGMKQGIYKLVKLNPIKATSGYLRQAVPEDAPLVAEWTHEFTEYTLDTLTSEECQERANDYIKQKSLYLWIDQNRPVSMVKWARPTKNGIVVTLVYTPDEERGKGYASSSVHAFSKLLLEKYEFCSLYTDLANPTSNSIYQKIGYEWVCESIMIQFGISTKGELVV
jgi:predicted GNAT family acetyltransferase